MVGALAEPQRLLLPPPPFLLRLSQHVVIGAAVTDEGATLEIRKPDKRTGQETVRRAHGAGAVVALRPLGAVHGKKVLEHSKPRILRDGVSIQGLDQLRLGGPA